MRLTGARKFPDAVVDAVHRLPPLDGAAVALRLAADSIYTNDEVSVGAREFADMYALVVGSMASGSIAALVDRIVLQWKSEPRGQLPRLGQQLVRVSCQMDVGGLLK
jgi:hypothetical protein